MTIEIWTKIPATKPDTHFELVQTSIDIPREFWRYLFAGLTEAARIGAGYQDDPQGSADRAGELLAELEKGGEP